MNFSFTHKKTIDRYDDIFESCLEIGACKKVIEVMKENSVKTDIKPSEMENVCMRGIDVNELTERYRPKMDITPHKCIDAIYGAIYGDITGSACEFREITEKQAEAYVKSPTAFGVMTDDSIMTMATTTVKGPIKLNNSLNYKKLLQYESLTGKTVDEYADAYRTYGRKYAHAGYGPRFKEWVHSDMKAYGSNGNGSAMRISPVGASGLPYEEMIQHAIASSACSHDHIEGIRGACVTATAIWLATGGVRKDDIVKYMQDMYSLPGENLFNSFTANEAMSIHHHQIQCQFSVPAASIAVDMSSSYEETIKNALMLGLDRDTNACIAGGIAGAIYGVSDKVKQVVEGAWMAKGLEMKF